MKKFLPVFTLLIATVLKGQDTLYYHFYNGVQMIEIRTYAAIPGLRDLTNPEDATLPIYLFRNQQGIVLKEYNVHHGEVIYSSLKTPQQLKNQLRRHREKDSTLTPKMHRYAFRGTVGFYPTRKPFPNNEPYYYHGIIDSLGNVVLPMLYTALTQTDSAYIFSRDARYGLMNEKFEITVPPNFEFISRIHKSTPYYNVKADGKWGMMDRNGKIVLSCSYEDVYSSSYDPGYFGVKQNNKWGLVDKTGKIVLPCKYDLPLMFFTNNYCKAKSNGLTGFIDSTVTEVLPTIYHQVEFDGKFFKVKLGETNLLMDRKTKVLCRSVYEIVHRLAGNRFVVKDQNMYGIIDSTGKIVDPINNDAIMPVGQNLAIAVNGKDEEGYIGSHSKWALIDAEGHRISKRYKDIQQLGKTLFFRVYDGERYGVIDGSGDIVFDLEYQNAEAWYYNGVCLTKNNRYYVFPSINARKRLPRPYDEKPYCQNGMARVKQGRSWGYLDSTGRLAIPLVYDEAFDFHNGVSVVRKKDKYWPIDKQGKQVGEGYYDGASQLQSGIFALKRKGQTHVIKGLAQQPMAMPYEEVSYMYDLKEHIKVSKDKKVGVIRINGEIVVPVENDEVYFTHNMFLVNRQKKMGYYDIKGNVLIPPVYDVVLPAYEYGNNIFWARLGEKYGVLDKNNKVLYPFIFEYPQGFSHRDYLHFSEEYLAELMLVKKETLELWYININGVLVGKREVDNPMKGFKTILSEGNVYERKYGLVNFKGITIVPFKYQHIETLKYAHFVVRNNNKFGLMDTTGKETIPCVYDEVRWVDGTNLVSVRHNKHWGLFQPGGNMLFDTTYNFFGEIPGGGLIWFSKGGTYSYNASPGHFRDAKIGIMMPDGRVVIEPQYDYIWLMDAAQGLMVCQKGNEMCVVDTSGRVVSGLVRASTANERWKMYKAG